jgi:hypothetical protein
VEAVAVGQAQVEQDDVGIGGDGLDRAVACGAGFFDAVVVRFERGPQESADRLFVLDDQDHRHVRGLERLGAGCVGDGGRIVHGAPA